MIYIEKESLEQSVIDDINTIKRSEEWRNIPEGDTKAIRAQFDMLPKTKIRESLLKEQHYLCAYCMRRIINNGSKMSIEHWYPLSKSKEMALDYKNMLGVCDGGKGTDADNHKRLLCCDASKGDRDELVINPLNIQQMKNIAYTKEGIMYTKNQDADMEHDINEVLHLNGILDDKKKLKSDTATEVVKGRRDAYAEYKVIMNRMGENPTATKVMKAITKIKSDDIMKEYAGVIIFFLERRCKQLEKQKR